MLLHELELRQDFIHPTDADMMLRRRGFQPIGHGGSARIYSHPNFDYVVKIYRDDPCYTQFVALAMSMSNPHFPQFRGKLTRIVRDVYAIRMERLTYSEYRIDLLDYIKTKVRHPGILDYDIEHEFPKLAEACTAISKILKTGCSEDIAEENIMQRGNIPVIIDPVTG